MEVHNSSIEIAHHYNGGFNEHTQAHSKRSLFFVMISEGKTVKDAVDICLQIPLSSQIMNSLKRLIKRVLKYILGEAGVSKIKKIKTK